MPVIVLRLPDHKTDSKDRPRICPYCGNQVLQRWGRVVRQVRDTRSRPAEVYRYRCAECQRTFRHYPKGIDQASQTIRIRYLAALAWVMGLSSREIADFFKKKGILLSNVTVWRDGREMLAQMSNGENSDILRKYSIDTVYLKNVSPRLGIVIAVDLGDGYYEILGTIDEFNPRSVKSWLDPLVRNLEIEVLQLGTGELNRNLPL